MKEKNKGKKLIVSGAFVVCMAFAIFFTAFRTNANEGTTSIVYEQRTKEDSVPTKEGFLFGGWYQEENDENAVVSPEQGKTYYAKFVPEDVLGIKAQVSNTILEDNTAQTAAIRFVTTVDSTQYKKIGFLVQKGTGEVTEANVTNIVYEKLYQVTDQNGSLGTVLEEVAPDIFAPASKFFKTYTIRKVPDSAYNTDITVTPYWITLDGTRVEGTKSIKTVNLGRSWVYIDTSANADGEVYGTYEHPFTKLDDALNGIRLENGKVTVKGNSTVTVPADFNWTKHTITVKEQVKDCNIMLAGETANAGIDFSAITELHVRDNITFDKMTLKFYGNSLSDYGEVYANGNDFTIAAGVASENQFTTIFGGSKDADVTGDTKIELFAGAYKAVCGGGKNGGVKGNTNVTIENANAYTADVSKENRIIGGSYNGGIITGNTNVTIGGNFNAELDATLHYERSSIFGGCYGTKVGGTAPEVGIVKGNTNVTIKDNAKTNYIYGGGSDYSSVEGTCNVNVNGGSAMSVWGGSFGTGENKDTSVIMDAGEVEQIYGGNNVGMTGNTYIEIKGGSVSRRIYGGCYNKYDEMADEWAATMHYVNGYTTVVVKGSNVLQMGTSTSEDKSVCAGSRCNKGSDDEVGILICTDNIYSSIADKVGYKGILASKTTAKAYNYLIDATTGGTVEAGGKMLQIMPASTSAKGTVAVDNNGSQDVQVYFDAACSWPMVNAGATTQKKVKVDFNAAPIADTSTFEASMGEIYYAQLEDAVDAANVRTDVPTVKVLKDADVERVMVAEKRADFTVKSDATEDVKLPVITGKVKENNVNAPDLFNVSSGGTLKIENLKLVNGHNAIRSSGTLTVNHVEIESPGNAGLSVSSKSNTATDLTITNAGGQGVVVAANAKADITNLAIDGTGSAAVRPMTSGEVIINGGNIKTNAYGIYLDGNCTGTITNVTVTAGGSSNAVHTVGTSALEFNGGSITATGAGAFGVYMNGGVGTITGTVIKADQESAVCTSTKITEDAKTGVITENNAELTLEGATIERTVSNGKALVSVRDKSIVTMRGEASRIDGKKASFTGRGVEVEGTFILNNGTIVGNKGAGASEMVTANVTDGCGVYVVAGGTFTMNGGTIEGNETTSAGAAVAVNGAEATFNLQNGTIQSNTATYGAVMAREGAFNMNGGTITGNTANTSGGGVVVSKGTFTMTGGKIRNNSAKNGGGVFANNGNGKIILAEGSTGVITENTATAYGGGVAIAPGYFEMNGGSITNNTATGNYGGGVDVNSANAVFLLAGGTISENSAKSGGGGVSIRACKSAVMNGGTIENNRGYIGDTIPGSGSFGGGIYLANGGQTFEMNGGTIQNNSARNCAAICVQSGDNAATVKYSGGTIQGNKAFSAAKGNGIKSTSETKPGTIIYLNNTSAADIADGVMTMTVGSQN